MGSVRLCQIGRFGPNPGGRLVANAITVEGESALYHWREETGGALVRIAVSRA